MCSTWLVSFPKDEEDDNIDEEEFVDMERPCVQIS